MTLADLLSVLALEDLDDLGVKLEAARSRAYGLPGDERTKTLLEIEIMERELQAQIRNQERRTGR